MALERIGSPFSQSSGRSSPAPRVLRRSSPEDGLYKKDKSYRRYAASVERALQLFDTPQQEWADYISFLSRLLKAVQSYPPEIPVVPHSATVATRLAQCMNPSLPSGVHQKAIEVYNSVFSIIGKEALSRDLYLYFPGLSSVLSFASLTVRPLFLSLLQTHILTLHATALRPAAKGIILCLLPGLEDETSEDFEGMLKAVDKLREALRFEQETGLDQKNEAEDSYFWQCFFLAVITNPSRRQGALSYLVRKLPKVGGRSRRGSVEPGIEEVMLLPGAQSIITPEPGLLVRCFASGLTDSQLLIQRGFLDLLVTHISLDSPVLQSKVSQDDLDRLVSAAAGVVIRRDMSLNRRLWAWFLGPEPSAPADEVDPAEQGAYLAAYFSRYGLQPLTRSILSMLRKEVLTPAERARPFRVCLSLMDRAEVGGLIVPEIFIPALENVERYSRAASKEQLEEVLRSASNFFDGVESSLIWGKLLELATDALQPGKTSDEERTQLLRLIKFIITRFNVKEEDMLIDHMPLLALSILVMTQARLNKPSSLKPEVLTIALDVLEYLIQSVPLSAFAPDSSEPEQKTTSDAGVHVLKSIAKFYSESRGSLDVVDTPFSPHQLAFHLTKTSASLFSTFLSDHATSSYAETSARIFATILYKAPTYEGLEDVDIFSVFSDALQSKLDAKDILPFQVAVAIITVLVPLQTASVSGAFIDATRFPDMIRLLVNLLWEYLSPARPKYHVEAVRCLLQLQSISPSARLLEASITSLMPSAKGSSDKMRIRAAEAGGRLAVLWTHTIYEQSLQTEKGGRPMSRRHSAISADLSTSTGGYRAVLTRPLFLMLDALAEDGTELFTFVKTWLQDLPSLNKVFEVLVLHLRPLRILAPKRNALDPSVPSAHTRSPSPADDAAECVYFLRHTLNILRWASDFTWVTLAEEMVQPLEGIQGASEEPVPLQILLSQICLRALQVETAPANSRDRISSAQPINALHRAAVSLLQQMLFSPYSSSLKELDLEIPLMERLKTASPPLQSLLLETIVAALKLRLSRPSLRRLTSNDRRRSTKELISAMARPSTSKDEEEADEEPSTPSVAPPQLIECLKIGFASSQSRIVLDEWVKFLAEVLPMFADTIFQNLLPLVEVFCRQIEQIFDQLRTTFKNSYSNNPVSTESTLISLMNGLEQILAKAHDRLVLQESKSAAIKPPEQAPQSFFGNVASVFSSETAQAARSTTANSRLTVLLCFQDTVRICFSLWSWGAYGDARSDPTSQASSAYSAVRLRNRARRILEHLFAAEALECLETLAVIWCQASTKSAEDRAVLGLLNVLNGSKPKHTIPAIFNALYSRSNPNALDPSRMSTMTSDLSDTDLAVFLVEYTQSLEDDAMDEIWPDCMTFLRDVLANPLPHRQILPNLLEFISTIAQKVDNTSLGEQKKMRRELGDLFTRLLTATFTTRSMGFLQDPSQLQVSEKAGGRNVDIISIMSTTTPHLHTILGDNDRIANVAASISTNVIGPTFRSKAFPENISATFLDVLLQLTRVAQPSKNWRKDIADAFNDTRFFASPVPIVKRCWLDILHQWTLNDKDRMPELLSRLSAPTTAGIMLGLGATSARLEADRKTQLNLRRIAVLTLSAPEDAFVPALPALQDKIVELLAATPTSSPSSVTRAEVFMLLRAIILKTSPVPLATLWPIINEELSSAISAIVTDDENHERYNNASILQACKLLDTLVAISPEDWQLTEWLYITDTIDAVYRPADWTAVALSDAVAEGLVEAGPVSTISLPNDDSDEATLRRPLLDAILKSAKLESISTMIELSRPELIAKVLRPFLGQLSLWAFEGWYNTAPRGKGDRQRCVDGLVADLFGGGVVGGE